MRTLCNIHVASVLKYKGYVDAKAARLHSRLTQDKRKKTKKHSFKKYFLSAGVPDSGNSLRFFFLYQFPL